MQFIEPAVAEIYHENTKIAPYHMGLGAEHLPSPIEPGVVLDRVRLPRVAPVAGVELEQAIDCRVTTRLFDPSATLPLALLSRLIAFSFGVTRPQQPAGAPPMEFHHAAPSAGARYPIEIYPIVLRVEGVPQGVYRYASNDHTLELIRPGDFRDLLPAWTLNQPYIANASVLFVMAGFSDRVTPRYDQRGYRYMLIECGHIGQNIYLTGTAYGLGVMVDGGFVDMAFNRLLGLNEITQMSLYIAAVGIPPFHR